MKISNYCLISLVGLLTLTIVHRVSSKATQAPNSNVCVVRKFDFALMSIQWAPGVCASASSCVKHGNEFIIHGMWPNYYNNSNPESCCYQRHLNKDALQPIMDKMKKHWKSLYHNDSFGFWIHEWQKHGTCASESALRGQFNYFNSTLSLYSKMPIGTWLTNSGITPSESGVALESVREAIRKGFTARPQLSCYGRHNSNSLPILTELRFCYDPQKLTPVNCPVESSSCRSKTGKVVLPPSRSNN